MADALSDNKAKIHTTYYFIDLYDDWMDFDYHTKENVMDQTDRYNFATGNWSYDLNDLEDRTFELLHILTCKEDKEIAAIIVHQAERVQSEK
jgi:hypothetical protein